MAASHLLWASFKLNLTCIFHGNLAFQSISNHYGRPCMFFKICLIQPVPLTALYLFFLIFKNAKTVEPKFAHFPTMIAGN